MQLGNVLVSNLNLMNEIDRHTGSLAIHGEASAKAGLYRDRFLLLFQRLARDHHFSKPAFDTEISHVGSCEVLSKLKPKPTSTLLVNFSFIASDSECLCLPDISNSVSSWPNWKKMGHGCDISIGRWPLFLGRPNCFR